MMTTTTNGNNVAAEESPRSPLWRLLIGLGALIVAMAALGAVTGIVVAGLEDGFESATFALLAGALLVGGVALFATYRLHRAARQEDPSERSRKVNRIMLWSCALGAGLGLLLAAGTFGSEQPFAAFSNEPLPGWVAALVIAIWLVAVPAFTWWWMRTVDEHELRAYNLGGLTGLHLYFFTTPAWWLGWRGGFLPEPDHMLTFCAVTLVWCAGWLWCRFR